MSVIDVKERHDERRASVKDGRRSYTHAFLVRTSDIHDSQAMVLAASGLPRYRDPHSDDNDALVSNIDVEPHENSGKHWICRYDFTAAEAEQVTLHPLARPAEFSYGNSDFSESYFLDESQPKRKPVLNGAGDPFETSSERTRSELTITMTRNEPTFSPIDADYYSNTSNQSAVVIDGHAFAPDTLLQGMPTASKERETWMGSQVVYYKVTRPFRARREGWKDTFLSVGYNELSNVPGPSGSIVKRRVPIVDGAGVRASRPVGLDANGKALPDPSGTPATCEFRPYRSVSWASLMTGNAQFNQIGEQEFVNIDNDIFGNME